MAVTTRYLVDDLNPTGLPQVVEEVVNGAVTRQYTYGLQRISQQQFMNNTWTPSFYVYDGGGSVRQLTNSEGVVTDEYEYDAYGNSFTKTGNTPNNYLYRGEQYDSDLGLYYLRARYYNPNTGRFMSRDPEDGDSFDPKSLHKYLYAGGDPVNGWDATGKNEDEDAEIEEDISLKETPKVKFLSKALIRCYWGIAWTLFNIAQGNTNYHSWKAYPPLPFLAWACGAAAGVPGF